MNIRMWWKALSIIPQISKEEWDELDVVAKWLIMTRSAVTTVSIFSSIVAGLFAWRDGKFDFLPWLIVTLGLFLAHGANNILNDYTDFSRGLDKDNYFRAIYGPHPLVHGFHDKKTQLRYFVASGVLALLAGAYAYYYTGFDSNILILIGIGAFFLLLYTYPLKYFALGELSIFFIWGPVMIGGVYYVLARQIDWNVIWASVAVGLSVMSINLGKHIDKLEDDKQRRVFTLPVVIGETIARYLDIIALIAVYGIIVYLIFANRFFTPVMLIVFLAAKPLFYALAVLSKPRPEEPPEEYPGWPIWFSGFTFLHNRRFTMLFILGVLIDTLLRVFVPTFWPPLG
jgi:1,4-dihydroxy-2-naphthoate octaprenyltransferase